MSLRQNFRKSLIQLGTRMRVGVMLFQEEAEMEPAGAGLDQVDAEDDAERIEAGVGPVDQDEHAEQQRQHARKNDPALVALAPELEAHPAADTADDDEGDGEDQRQYYRGWERVDHGDEAADD